ncbi:MAG: lyase-like protein [Pedosphaera sp.]|nr:lyase-like protein [Pedosphaera sp.]
MFTLTNARFGMHGRTPPRGNNRAKTGILQILTTIFSGVRRPSRRSPKPSTETFVNSLNTIFATSVATAGLKQARSHIARVFLCCAIFASVTGLCSAVTTNNNSSEWIIPTGNAQPTSIILGPDNSIWFPEFFGGKIGRIDTNGNFVEFTISTSNPDPFGIATGPDGNIWFTENYANKIGRLNLHTGVINDWSIPTANSQPSGIAVGPDNNLWFLEYGGDKIGVINTNGQFLHEYTNNIQTNSLLYAIVKGPDNNIWFTDTGHGRIGRINTNGLVMLFQLPATNAGPTDIIVGPDNAMWFTESTTNKIGRLTTDVFASPPNTNALTEYILPFTSVTTTSPNQPYGLLSGNDGNIWFGDRGVGSIDRLILNTPGTNVTQFFPPTANSGPTRLAIGADRNIWFGESANNIGRLLTNGLLTSSVQDILLTNGLTINGVIASFQDAFPPDQPHTAFSATINWGDGSSVTTSVNPSSISINHLGVDSYQVIANHTYVNAPGNLLPATLFITDSNGDTAIDTFSVSLLPVLTIQLTNNNQVVVSWPSAFTSFKLQTKTNFAGTNWITMSNLVGNKFTNTITTPTLYRLKK